MTSEAAVEAAVRSALEPVLDRIVSDFTPPVMKTTSDVTVPVREVIEGVKSSNSIACIGELCYLSGWGNKYITEVNLSNDQKRQVNTSNNVYHISLDGDKILYGGDRDNGIYRLNPQDGSEERVSNKHNWFCHRVCDNILTRPKNNYSKVCLLGPNMKELKRRHACDCPIVATSSLTIAVSHDGGHYVTLYDTMLNEIRRVTHEGMKAWRLALSNERLVVLNYNSTSLLVFNIPSGEFVSCIRLDLPEGKCIHSIAYSSHFDQIVCSCGDDTLRFVKLV